MDTSKLFLLTNIPGILDIIKNFRKDRNWQRLVRDSQIIFDFFSKQYMLENNQYVLLAVFEFAKISGKLLKLNSKEDSPLLDKRVVPFTPRLLRLLRPFIYLLMVAVLGRNSWRALGTSGLIELFSDRTSWAKYALRSPVFDSFTIRLVEKLPGLRLLAQLAKSYQAYISYTL